MVSRVLLAAFIAVLVLAGALYAEAVMPDVEYLYRLGSEGFAHVTVLIDGVEGEYVIYVKVEESIIEESVVAVDEFNDVLLTKLVDGDILIVHNVNGSKRVIINYVAMAGRIKGAYVDVLITPSGPSKVLLPRSSALLYFNGSADVSFTDTTIVITYNSGGAYLISYIPSSFMVNLTSPTTHTPVAEQQPPSVTQLLTTYLYVLTFLPISAVLAYYLIRRRRARPAGVSVESPEYDVETLTTEVDERDVEVLSAAMTKELTISGLARELRLSKSVAWRRIRKLSNLKLITTVDVNGKTYIKVTPLGVKVLEEVSKKGRKT